MAISLPERTATSVNALTPREIVAEVFVEQATAIPIPERYGHGALGGHLSDDVLIQFGYDLFGGQVFHFGGLLGRWVSE